MENQKNSRSPFTSYVAFFILIFSMTSVYADSRTNWMPSHINSTVRIDVVDDSGHYLKQHPTNSRGYNTQRAYLEAVKGKRYQIRIRNTSNRRIGLVVAVDGRNILTGKKSHLRSNEKMYILDPYETANYKGWRTAKNRVNRFYFTSAGDSYSNAWGDRSAMGVIAVAVYNEKQRYYRKKYRNSFSDKAAPSTSSRRYKGESAGTGFGQEEYSPSVNVRFIANNKASNKYFYKYEWRSTLCKRRIINCNRYDNNHRNNNRFWPEDNGGYAPYPPGRPTTPPDFYIDPWSDFDTSR